MYSSLPAAVRPDSIDTGNSDAPDQTITGKHISSRAMMSACD